MFRSLRMRVASLLVVGIALLTGCRPALQPKQADNPAGYEFVRIPAGKGVAAFEIGKYDVTVAQFRKFVEATGHKTTAETQGWSYGMEGTNWRQVYGLNWRYGTSLKDTAVDNHPVVHVTQADAEAFCKWVGGRLPTNAEWEHAARGGLQGKKYVWGDEWPPPRGAGNFVDETAKKKYPHWTTIEGYDDGYADTSPVGAFQPNSYGLYDMSGNVEQRVAEENQYRGGSFGNQCFPNDLAVVSRGTIDAPYCSLGFRVARTQPEKPKPPVTPAPAGADNSAGYEFVRIPAGEGVAAFEIGKYDVTVAQFRKFVEAKGYKTTAERLGSSWGWTGRTWRMMNGLNWKFGSNLKDPAQDNHPVVNVSWEDAKAFCEWVGGRLPTDDEWEHAARGGLQGKKYVWGDEWPPPPGSGNFADVTAKRKYKSWNIIEGYDDGYADTSPVGSFKPNGYGVYDMAGNVWQWVDSDAGNGRHGCRGGSLLCGDPGLLRVDNRGDCDSPDCDLGFRVGRTLR